MSFLIPGYKSTVKTISAQRSLENTLKNREISFQNFIASCIPLINRQIDTYSNIGYTKIVIRISTNGSIESIHQLPSNCSDSELYIGLFLEPRQWICYWYSTRFLCKK